MTTVVDSDVVLRVQDLGKRYGTTWALRNCSFDLMPGRVTALVGANGAGKTTLLTLLSGLLRPDEGKVQATGRVAFVAQDKPLYKHFSAADMLKLARRLNLAWDQSRAEAWLQQFNVPMDRACGRLSTGQQTQVALATALGSRPDLLLLDEPLSALDPLVRREVMAELLTASAETGLALLLSTHVLSELGGVADQLLLLGNGKLALTGEVDTLMTWHQYYVGPRAETPPAGQVVRESHDERQSTFLVQQTNPQPVGEPWITRPATIEDIMLAYLANARNGGAE